MMNNNDIRPGRNRFPYGDRHDMGISLEKVVGSAEIPGTTVNETYVAITLHMGYYDYAAAEGGTPFDAERTIYIKAALFGSGAPDEGAHLVTIRLGQSFQSAGSKNIKGRVAGVVGEQGLIGLFSWRVSAGSLELFPDSAMRVFDSVLTAADIDGTSWGGASAYSAATTGAPLYYFFWDSTQEKLSSPARRVLPVDEGSSPYPKSNSYFGVFVPIDGNGDPLPPIPAFYMNWSAPVSACAGGISVLEDTLTSTPDNNANVGSAKITGEPQWGPPGDASTDVKGLNGGYVTPFNYETEFLTAKASNYTSGYMFSGWYDSSLAVTDPSQNPTRFFAADDASLSCIHLLDEYLGFDGTGESPEEVYLILTPTEGESPSVSAHLEFSVSGTAATGSGEASGQFAFSFTEGTKRYCSGSFLASMWVTMYTVQTLKYNDLANGSTSGQLLYWDQTTSKWLPGIAGGAPGQLMSWNATSKMWTPDLAGSATGQLLYWTGSKWAAGSQGAVNTHLLCWNQGSRKWVPGLIGTTAGQILKWSATGWIIGTGIPDGTMAGQLLTWQGGTTGWTSGLAGSATGQLLQWNNSTKAWTVGLAGSSAGQFMKWLGGTTGWTAGTGIPDGSATGQLLKWDVSSTSWVAGLTGSATGQLMKWLGGTTGWSAATVIPDGTATGQILKWDASSSAWVAGLTASATGQVLRWQGGSTGWSAATLVPDGTATGQLLKWDTTSSAWVAGLTGSATGQLMTWQGGSTGWAAALAGTATGQLLQWDNSAKVWTAGLTGSATGQILTWFGGTTGWAATASPMPTGADKNTMYYDGTTGWTANGVVKWSKLVTGSPSSGGMLQLDLTGCPARAGDSAMPGFAINHPSGGTCGVFANIESGNAAGARLDIGWGGANGGNFELYSNTHPTRPGEFRIIYGPNGHIEFKNFQSGSDWHVTSGLSKEGRFFCGFCDVQYPGVSGNFGTYIAPAFPLQIFNEAHQDSKVVAGVSKEGRGFFGCLGNPATGLPAYPLEIYNEAGATASARVAGISKNGRAFFGVSGSTAPSLEHPLEIYNESGTALARKAYISKDGKILTTATVSAIAHTAQLDCNDITMSTGATAQTIKLREMVIPYKSGSAVKGKLAQVMCGAGYGAELDLGGRPATPTASKTIGSTTESDLSSSYAYDPASPETGMDGLTVIVSLGSFYDHTAATPVLKEFRVALTWPNAIAPKISAAYTVPIDTPEQA